LLEAQLHSRCTASINHRHSYQDIGSTRPDVTTRARRSGVAGGAPVRVAASDRTMRAIEPLGTVIGWFGVRGRATRHEPRDANVGT